METETAPRARKKSDRKDFRRVLVIRKIKKEECMHPINKGVNVSLFLEKNIGDVLYLSKKEATNFYFDDPKTNKASVRLKPNYRGPVCLIPKDSIMIY